MKTNFFPPPEIDLPSNYHIQLYECGDDDQRKLAIEILSQYDGRRAPENYTPERLDYALRKRVKYLIVVRLLDDIIFAACLGIHNNWLHITRAVKFKYWKQPILLGVCFDKLMQLCELHKLDGMFTTFNEHNKQYMLRTFRSSKALTYKGWIWEKALLNREAFEVNDQHMVMFNNTLQYVVKTRSTKELTL